jgi:hypothetical protein
MDKLRLVFSAFLLVMVAARAHGELITFPNSPANDHLRIVAWNLEFFNDREFKTAGAQADRSSAQLDLLAARILGFDASVIALQEVDELSALYDLRDRMGGPWSVYGGSVDLFGYSFPQQNALLYDASKVDLVSAGYVYRNPGSDPDFYPEWPYRSPVTGVFSPIGHSEQEFRIIGIHAHFNNVGLRDTEGYWLSDYVDTLLADPSETDHIVLLGDFNGMEGAPPHNGLLSGGNLVNVQKRNGELTTVYPDLKLDYIYATEPLIAQLTDPTAFVIRPEHYGETPVQFEDTYSDHLPVFIDYRVIPAPDSLILLACGVLILLAIRPLSNQKADVPFGKLH